MIIYQLVDTGEVRIANVNNKMKNMLKIDWHTNV